MDESDMFVNFRRKTVLTYEEILAIHAQNKTQKLDIHILLSLIESIEGELQNNSFDRQMVMSMIDECKIMVKKLIYEKFNFEELFFKFED